MYKCMYVCDVRTYVGLRRSISRFLTEKGFLAKFGAQYFPLFLEMQFMRSDRDCGGTIDRAEMRSRFRCAHCLCDVVVVVLVVSLMRLLVVVFVLVLVALLLCSNLLLLAQQATSWVHARVGIFRKHSTNWPVCVAGICNVWSLCFTIWIR